MELCEEIVARNNVLHLIFVFGFGADRIRRTEPSDYRRLILHPNREPVNRRLH